MNETSKDGLENQNCESCNENSAFSYLINAKNFPKNCVKECPKGTILNIENNYCEEKNEELKLIILVIFIIIIFFIIFVIFIIIYIKNVKDKINVKLKKNIKDDMSINLIKDDMSINLFKDDISSDLAKNKD